ncbi:MAG: hypothetical protein ACREMA_09370 [Longimicrobiales bacterium]
MKRSLLTGYALAVLLVSACGPREQEADVPPVDATTPEPAPAPVVPPPAQPTDSMKHDTVTTTTGM